MLATRRNSRVPPARRGVLERKTCAVEPPLATENVIVMLKTPMKEQPIVL
jgi:hypothetical protein